MEYRRHRMMAPKICFVYSLSWDDNEESICPLVTVFFELIVFACLRRREETNYHRQWKSVNERIACSFPVEAQFIEDKAIYSSWLLSPFHSKGSVLLIVEERKRLQLFEKGYAKHLVVFPEFLYSRFLKKRLCILRSLSYTNTEISVKVKAWLKYNAYLEEYFALRDISRLVKRWQRVFFCPFDTR